MGDLNSIDHFVVLMLENRSFDSLLGRLYPKSDGFNGLSGDETNLDASGNPVMVWSENATEGSAMMHPVPDPGELWVDMNMQLFGSRAAPAPSAAPTMSGFAANYQAQSESPPYDPREVMHFYTPEQVPVLSRLAQQFAVCDCWHASAPCQTWPNRFFVHTATANGYENNSPARFPYEMPTIYNRFENLTNGNTWKIYFHDMPQSVTLSKLWDHPDHFRFYTEFCDDAKHGTLPSYSFLEPRYFPDVSLPNDQHPPHVVTLGEQLIADVYNHVRASPLWTKTLLIITYDEHGGAFDHVPPPAATPPLSPLTAPFGFDRYGVRVPAVLVSPYIRQGTVLRPPAEVPFDHTSIIATLRKRFDLGPPLSNRDAVAPTLESVLGLSTPDNMGPESLDALQYVATPAEVASAQAIPLNGMQKALLVMAKQLPGNEPPQETLGQEIEDVVETIEVDITTAVAEARGALQNFFGKGGANGNGP
jgi:phospholipase C